MPTRRTTLGLIGLAPLAAATSVVAGPGRSGYADGFAGIDPKAWHVADYSYDHPAFANGWSRRNARVRNGLHLALTVAGGVPTGAALRRRAATGFGRYAARLRAGSGAGVVTGFFLYSGPAFGSAHDEIDFEFLGNDPRAVHLSWWKDGVLHQRRAGLPFDTTAGVHDYAINWRADGIAWSADGHVLHTARRAVPQRPLFPFLNIWAARPALANWAGPYAGTTARAWIVETGFTPA